MKKFLDEVDEDEELTFEELTRPIKAVEEKWKLLPHFLKMRGMLSKYLYFVLTMWRILKT